MDVRESRGYEELWTGTGDAGGTAELAVLAARNGSQLLLPTVTNRAMAAPLIRHTAALSRSERLARRLGWMALRTGIARPLLRRRMRVPAGGTGTDVSIHQHLAEVLGRRQVVLSVVVGPSRPNRKPVIRIMSRSGDTVGFAKLGGNELTARLVDSEAAFLASGRAGKLRRALVPEVIHHGEWGSHRLSVLTPLLGRPGPAEATAAAFEEVAGLDGVRHETLASSRYWSLLQDRAAALSPELRSPVDRALGVVEWRWADADLAFGRWHGDWTLWNMARGPGRRLILWDWERTAEAVPLGFDPVHLHSQPLFHTRQDRLADLVVQSDRRSAALLTELGVAPEHHDAIRSLHLVELYLRHAAVDGAEAVSPLLDRLGRLMALRQAVSLAG